MKNATLLISLLGLGCVSDFSPDPRKGDPNHLVETDAGKGKPDAGKPSTDAKVAAPKDAAEPPVDSGSSEPVDAGMTAEPKGPCDLSGRWIATEHNVSVAIGAAQLSRGWFYAEIRQQGDELVVARSVFCGGSTKEAPGSPMVTMDDSAAWPGYQKYANYEGRKGTSKESGGGCEVEFQQAALLRGASSAYRDGSVALPTVDQEANEGAPGWEDWDEDGHPGITMSVTGLATGKMFTAMRTLSEYRGAIEATNNFRLLSDWSQERRVYGTEPGDPVTRSLLASDATRSPDDDENFVEFARLADDQATGDDDALCEAIRALAPTLNPEANAN